MSTAIQWTDETDNIFRVKGGGWWCRKISPGCANCYAAKLNQSSFFGGNKMKYIGDAPEMELQTDLINSWSRMTKPKRHFVASMTDIFGDWVTQDQAIEFLRGMWRAPKQTFQMLTKRPDIAADRISKWMHHDMLSELPSNMWIGASVENQAMADKRIPELLRIPAKVRFLSVEPMLEAIEFTKQTMFGSSCLFHPAVHLGGRHVSPENTIHWVIFGGESGPGARPCNVDWIRDGVRQCKSAGVAAFVKQLGAVYVDEKNGIGGKQAKAPAGFGIKITNLKNPKGGDMSEWPADLRVREFPNL